MSALLASRLGSLASPWWRLASTGALAAPLALTRSQPAGRALALASDGSTWIEYDANQLRFTGASQRLLLEPARTNLVENPRFEGASAGIAGTAPANWAVWSSSAAGITRQIVGTGTINGLPYIDTRYFGTPSSTSGASMVSASNTVSAGLRYVASGWFALVGGSTANLAATILRVAAETGTSFTPGGSLARIICKRTLSGTTTNWTLRQSYINTTDAVDFTLRIAAPQLELTAPVGADEASTPILPLAGSPAATLRGADLAAAPLSSLGIGGNGACTLLWSGLIPQAAPSGIEQVLLQVGDSTDNNCLRLRNAAGGATIVAGRVLAGAASDATSLGSMTPGTPFRAGITIDGSGRVAGCFNGGAVQAVTGGPTSGLTTLRLGNNAAGTAALFGEVGWFGIRPFAVPDAALPGLLSTLPL